MVYHKTAEGIKRFSDRIDWILCSIVGLFSLSGLLMLYSALLQFGNLNIYISKQVLGLVVGVFGLIVFTAFNYQIFRIYFSYTYVLSIIFLITVLVIGKSMRGAKSWIDLGYFSFQPCEITKLLFIIAIAGYLDKVSRDIHRWQKLVIPVILLLGNVGLILLQPDFSSTLVYFPVFLVMLYCANVRILHLAGIVLYGVITISLPLMKTFLISDTRYIGIVRFLQNQLHVILIICAVGVVLVLLWWFLKQMFIFIPLFYFICIFGIIVSGVASSYVVDRSMKEYQKKRLIVFLDSSIDPLGISYNINQSRIAIGSGRLLGKGMFNGTQGQLGFVPAQHTDFIFSLVGEETGFFFSGLIITLYFLLVWRATEIARSARDRYGALVAVGVATMFAFYGVTNIGMAMGLMPVTGLPLPFFSYGGSCMVSSLMAIGILLSVYTRRFVY
jgi:rod shape determining protein RodA